MAVGAVVRCRLVRHGHRARDRAGHRLNDHRNVKVVMLELDTTSEAPAGQVLAGGGSNRPFHGWIGLMGVIESLLDEIRDGAEPTGEREEEER